MDEQRITVLVDARGRRYGVRPGRKPRLAAGASTRRREFRLTDEENRALERLASEIGTPIAELVRDAVNEYVADFTDRRVFDVSSGRNVTSALS